MTDTIGRKGIGHDMEKKRKLKELYEESLKRQKQDSDTFLNNFRSEQLDAQMKKHLHQAQLVCQTLDMKASENKEDKSIRYNVFWRGLEKDREDELKEKQFRRRMLYERSAVSQDADSDYEDVVQELDDEDEELEEFRALPIENQLEMILHYMREKYYYCFWYTFIKRI
jgi:Domain of unknown function (DUF4187)